MAPIDSRRRRLARKPWPWLVFAGLWAVVLIVNLSSLPLHGARIVQTVGAGLLLAMGLLAAVTMASEQRRERRKHDEWQPPPSGGRPQLGPPARRGGRP